MLAFRSLDPFRALREPDRRRRDEERLSRSEQKTVSATQNNPLDRKSPIQVYELSVPERRTLNDKCRGAIVEKTEVEEAR